MSLIDQRILIAAPAEAVWVYLANPTLIVKWHQGCRQISILSTRTWGVGMRRRCTDAGGQAIVEEITAWLENLGYEYVMVDGPFHSFRGRVRLQAIPEGTIVNWTVEYSLRGVLGGVRNALGARSRIENQMAESLRQLRKVVESSGARIDPEKQARFAMQRAPSVEARAALAVERPPVPVKAAPEAQQPVTLGDDDIPEAPSAPPTRVETPEPSFVSKLAAVELPAVQMPPSATDESLADTKPRRPKGLDEAIKKILEKEAAQPITEPAQWDADAPTVPVDLVAPPYQPPPPAGPTEVLPPVPSAAPDTLPERVPTPRFVALPKFDPSKRPPTLPDMETPPDGTLPPPTTIHDTGEVSIWEVFGMKPPSERTRTDLQEIIASLQMPTAPDRSAVAGATSRTLARKAGPPVRAARLRPARGILRARARTAVKVRRKAR